MYHKNKSSEEISQIIQKHVKELTYEFANNKCTEETPNHLKVSINKMINSIACNFGDVFNGNLPHVSFNAEKSVEAGVINIVPTYKGQRVNVTSNYDPNIMEVLMAVCSQDSENVTLIEICPKSLDVKI